MGGGLVSTPAIRMLLGYPALVAVGTPLAVVFPTTITGAWQYARRGNLDWRAALAVGLAGMPGAAAGAAITPWVGGSAILIATGGVFLWIAYRLASSVYATACAPKQCRLSVFVGLGVLAGLFSGFFGLGGGLIIVPGLMYWARRPIRMAFGTSLVAITLIALPGIAVHAWLGNIDWALAAALVVGVVPGAAFGAGLAHVAEERWLRYFFAAFLVIVAVIMAGSEVVSGEVVR